MAFDSAGLFKGIQLVFHPSPQGERGLYWDGGGEISKIGLWLASNGRRQTGQELFTHHCAFSCGAKLR